MLYNLTKEVTILLIQCIKTFFLKKFEPNICTIGQIVSSLQCYLPTVYWLIIVNINFGRPTVEI